jgi:acylphosphatase
MPSYIGKRFVLEGRVQGVGCRARIQEIVESIGHISGHVKNLPEGSVEVCVKGPDWRMADLEKVLKDQLGYPIQVTRFSVENMPPDYAPTGFRILRDP